MINIVLFSPEIPQNTGNIMRTCAGTGAKLHLIKPLGFRLDEKSIKRSGVNYINYCNYTVYETFDEFFQKNTGNFFFFTRYSNKNFSSVDYGQEDNNIFLIFGRESTGIPLDVLKSHLEQCVRIPMNNNIRALNLSNSVAIATYEVLRQQNYNGLLFSEPFKGENYIYE